jgi:uncharacterized protein (TIGR03067 family)
MRYIGSFIAVCCFLLTGNAAQDDPAKKDLDSLQGGWQYMSWVADGNPAPKEEVKGLKIVIKGNKLTFIGFGKGIASEATIKLDPSKKPKAIDLAVGGGTEPQLGIYSIEGDTLKMYFCNSMGGERPTEFKDGQNVSSFMLKREKRRGDPADKRK